ncbi:class F sortase [Phycicoccus sonneratiae]|uniref:Class F sortase n=1 Tax=Phycicoccus sonneratiae TaxID=2807628 RepID=A0ABS2CR38_9MICO|nr:class F sortase [Phycicoccus sonneraticus]MBM6402278.1 class F sortase [Phycicoccus sonneraticus]
MTAPPGARRWGVASVASLAVAVGALLALALWVAGRPGETSGDGAAGLQGATPTTSAPTPAATPSVRATARPAAPGASRRPVTPAPVRLRVPDLDVDATVRPVGVQDDGAMVIPAAPTSVGWYRYGAAPSDPVGHTVIAGHVATREDGPGALAPLTEAEEGMRVEVTDADGTVHRYVVEGRTLIRKKALPVDDVFARDGPPRLVLVTCGGEYLPELRSHRDNVVVTAVPVS